MSGDEHCGSGEVVNLGNPDEFSVNELAEEVSRVIGKPARVEYKELPEDDPKVRCPDISKMTRLTGWKPSVGLQEGLRKTIPYFKEEIGK